MKARTPRNKVLPQNGTSKPCRPSLVTDAAQTTSNEEMTSGGKYKTPSRVMTRSASNGGGCIKKQKVEKQAQRVSLRRTLKILGLWTDTESVIDQSVASNPSPSGDLEKSLESDASYNTKSVGNTPPPSHGVLSTTRPPLTVKNDIPAKKPPKKAKKQLFKGLKSFLAHDGQENLNATMVEPSATKKVINVFRSKSINRLADLAPKLRSKMQSNQEVKPLTRRPTSQSVASPAHFSKSLINLTSPELGASIVGYAEVGVRGLRSFASVRCMSGVESEVASSTRPRRSSRRFSDQLESPLHHLAQLSLNSGSPGDACETSLNATLTGEDNVECSFKTSGPRWRQLSRRLSASSDCKTPTNERVLSPSPRPHSICTPSTLTKNSVHLNSSTLKKSTSKSFSTLNTSTSSLHMKLLPDNKVSEEGKTSSAKRRRSNRIADMSLLKNLGESPVLPSKSSEVEAKRARLDSSLSEAATTDRTDVSSDGDDIGDATDIIKRQRRLSASVRFNDQLPRKYATVDRASSMKRTWKNTLRRNSHLGDIAAGLHEGQGQMMRNMAGHTPKTAPRRRHPSYDERLI